MIQYYVIYYYETAVTVKPAHVHVVTSIKQSPELKGHLFLLLF